jgi:hypothetical protein
VIGAFALWICGVIRGCWQGLISRLSLPPPATFCHAAGSGTAGSHSTAAIDHCSLLVDMAVVPISMLLCPITCAGACKPPRHFEGGLHE